MKILVTIFDFCFFKHVFSKDSDYIILIFLKMVLTLKNVVVYVVFILLKAKIIDVSNIFNDGSYSRYLVIDVVFILFTTKTVERK